MSVLGSGPVMELMTLRRIYADGFTPSVVLLEYWPPFLGSDASWAETNRIATDRLLDCDRPLVRGYFPDPDRIEREMDRQRVNPIFASRARLMNHVSPNAILPTQRANAAWEGLDPWGWKPGVDMKPELAQWRTDAVAMCGDIYRPLLAKYRLSRDVERALRDSVALAREHGATVGFLFMPESSDFRRLYPPRTEQKVRDHLANLSRELNVPVIDTRAWMPDDDVADSFHLSRQGAAAFTRKLGPVVAEMLDPEARP
jgi:hypothetical protein